MTLINNPALTPEYLLSDASLYTHTYMQTHHTHNIYTHIPKHYTTQLTPEQHGS